MIQSALIKQGDADFNIILPFPPTVSVVQGSSHKQHGLSTLKNTLYNIVSKFWFGTNQSKIVSTIQSIVNPLFSEFSKTDFVLTTEILHELVKAADIFAIVYRKEVIDTLCANDFFFRINNSRTCLKQWYEIVANVINANYPERHVVITDVLNRVSTSIFTSKEAEN